MAISLYLFLFIQINLWSTGTTYVTPVPPWILTHSQSPTQRATQAKQFILTVFRIVAKGGVWDHPGKTILLGIKKSKQKCHGLPYIH